MINLLPDDKKEELMRIYMMRVTLTALCAFLGLELLVIASLVPSYLYLRSVQNAADAELAELVAKHGATDTAVSDAIKRVAGDVALMRPNLKEPTWSSISTRVASVTIPGITITAIAYDTKGVKEGSSGTVQLRGVAADRDVFFAFRSRLISDPSFLSVDMPSSAFVKEKDIDFTVALQLRP